MTATPEQLEWIVQEVIRRLQRTGDAAPAAGGELWLSDRVVTLAALKDRLTNVRRVVVTQRAVVTPAARDELNDRQIELIREG